MINNIFNHPETHEVYNQTPQLKDYNAYSQDVSLQHFIHTYGAGWAEERVRRYGSLVGDYLIQAGFDANKNLPEYISHDKSGYRVNEVIFHPAYHQLMRTAIESGWPVLPWSKPEKGAHVARAAMEYLHHQVDSGTGCPLTMSFAAMPVIKQNNSIASIWEPLLLSRTYNSENTAYFNKQGVTIGMGMTEKQGGTDVQANTTKAVFVSSSDLADVYQLYGHKWFMSAPMCDAFIVLAQTQNGLSCFLMPRWFTNDCCNHVYIQQLKNKLGNQSNASSEVEFRGAYAWLLGEQGRGVATIIQMVALTRFDCIVSSSGLMRQALVQALHHCQYRKVSGQYLINQPLMQNVLTDLVVECEASLAMSMRLASALDHTEINIKEKKLIRIATAIGKYWVCKRAPAFIFEAMECMGGNAYVETSILPRLYREAPVNSIWEGSGNVQCLDVLRSIERDRECLDVLFEEIHLASGLNNDFDKYIINLEREISRKDNLEYRARHIVEKLALAFQASLLLRDIDSEIADMFCSSRLTEIKQFHYGGLGKAINFKTILQRAWPQIV